MGKRNQNRRQSRRRQQKKRRWFDAAQWRDKNMAPWFFMLMGFTIGLWVASHF